ncbi:Disease resistance protein [Senna tora]|uniref:Disease resistance protein n=1 Tax=Senna tora TaxID=362788 RepID=A0A834WXF1_9FABA|nr:Disease resistance protein [Senna tora]
MDIAASVVADIVSKLVDTAIHQARYPFEFNKYVKELELEKVNLQSKIESVLNRVQEAKKKTEKTVSAVDVWLQEADSLMAEVVEMEEKAKKRNKKSCLKYCPSWFRRYGLAKKLEEKIGEIIEHNRKDLPEFSRIATLVGMSYFSSEAFVPFNSRKVACDGLLEALKNDKVRMIGLWGMGGCGKTTLVKEVSKEAENFFDKVVFVTVSNTIQVRSIQGKTASQLGLKLEEEEETERARRLFMRLNGGERFLIILDDVWEMLDFEAIGIPVGENKNGCTVLITTRERRVCTLMNCQSIGLEILNMEEALTLFQKHAQLFDENSETKKLKVLAENITKECGGLPVAIAAVASSLRGKTQAEWVEALETLRDCSPVDIGEGLKNPYTCLRLSYDNLKNEVAKSLFLLCSVFPEDFEIDIDDLAIFGIALGLIGEIHSLKRARNQVSIAINKLVDSCLLLGDKEKGVISMHDLVRDVALWIAKNENKMIMGPERSQKVLKVDMILKDNSIRYLWLEGVDKFPHELDCPNLEFLRISIESKHGKYVTNEFLNGLKKLRVLFLEHQSSDKEQVLELPESIHSINNLRYLLLDGWILGDISLLGSLERLVSLTLRYCSFDELPKSISEQKNLRLLHISDCEIKRNSYEVIGRCSKLEELYFYCNSGEEWKDKGENAVEFFDKNCATLALERYNVVIENVYRRIYYEEVSSTITRAVSVGDFESCISNETIRDLMQRAHAISLARISSCKNFVPDIVERIGGDMNELTVLELRDSDGTEYVIDIPNHSALGLVRIISNLTQLELSGLKNLKTLCNGRPPQGLFANLEILILRHCNSLEHIITDEVEEEIVEDDIKYTLAFPNLKKIDMNECNQLEYIFPISYTLSLPQLNVLTIRGAAKLKNIFGQSNYKDQNPNVFQSIEFLALRELTLYDLPNIISICAENYHPSWPSLESLDLRNCPQLTTMSVSNHSIPHSGLTQDPTATKEVMEIHLEKLNEIVLRNFNIDVLFHLEGQQMNSGLYHLKLEGLPELKHIWIGPKNVLQLQNLNILDIRKCEILKVAFSTTISRNLPQLSELIIMDCKELEEIIEEEDQNVSDPQLLFPNLTLIIIRRCHKLKRVFPNSTSLPKLKVLWIEDASQLEHVFGNEEEETVQKMEGMMIPILKYVVLMKLPKLKMGPQLIGLQTVRYCLVQDSQYLNFTSTIATLEDLHQICKNQKDDNFDEEVWRLRYQWEDIIESNEDSREEITEQIQSKETHEDEAASEIVDIYSQVETNQNNSGIQSKQKLTPIASSNLTKELVDKISTSKPSLAVQHQPLAEFEIANDEIPLGTKSVIGSTEAGSLLKNAEIVTSSTCSEPTSISPGPLNATLPNEPPYRQIKVNQTEANIDKDTETNPFTNLEALEDDDLIRLFQSLEEDDGGQLPIPSVPIVATTNNELVAKALADLEVSLKMPLKDIASSQANSLRLHTTLNFLSRLSLEDGALSDGLKAIIHSLHQEFPSILCSFKQAFGTIIKFSVLDERDKCIKEELAHRKEAAITLVSKMSKTKKFMNEAQEKQARLKEHISRLAKEIQDCEAELLSLEEQKKKCVVETKEFKKEFESVKNEKAEMVEDERKARQQLFQLSYSNGSNSNLIRQSCRLASKDDPTFSYDFCVSSLEANFKSTPPPTTFEQLAEMSIRLAKSNATNLILKIRDLLNHQSERFTEYAKSCLEDCIGFYSDSSDELESGMYALKSEPYGCRDASEMISAALATSTICENQFKEREGEVSPITKDSTIFVHLIHMSLDFAHMCDHTR